MTQKEAKATTEKRNEPVTSIRGDSSNAWISGFSAFLSRPVKIVFIGSFTRANGFWLGDDAQTQLLVLFRFLRFLLFDFLCFLSVKIVFTPPV